ncbi:MAG: GxxExxY protein [Deltaproteobacteria bacterium]|nr:GxxExxY protein [Deltaproteobacteria bacterium]
MKYEKITEPVIQAAIEVHKNLGPGLLESVYEQCLAYELTQKGINFKLQYGLPVEYKGVKLDCGYRIDVLIEDHLILELKSVDRILPIHEAQILTYMKLANVKVGLLINFNVLRVKDGIKRFVL